MKRKLLVRRLLSGVLVLLGFSSCSEEKEIPCEYGSPIVDYQVKGKVLSSDGENLKGIQVIIKDQYGYFKKDPYSPRVGADTIYTDEMGNFESSKVQSITLDELKVVLNDVDGEAGGGAFKSDSVPINKLDKKQTEESKGWYKGAFELTTIVKLSKKEKP